MKRFEDKNLRHAIYGIYLATFDAAKLSPYFNNSKVTTIMTGFMGIEGAGWHVVGITENALKVLKNNDFRLPPRTICRGHLVDRAVTVRQLFECKKPVSIEQLFAIYLANDKTVLMLNEENKNGTKPNYIEFDNPDADYFPNNSLIGWKHRNKERDFLRMLCEQRNI